MVLSALIFIEMTCEVGLVKFNLESLKMRILLKNVKKAEAPSISRLQLAPNSPLASELLGVLACGEQMYSPWRVRWLRTVVVFAICFAWDFERSPLGSVSEILYPLMYAVKMNDDGSIKPLLNDVLLNISDV